LTPALDLLQRCFNVLRPTDRLHRALIPQDLTQYDLSSLRTLRQRWRAAQPEVIDVGHRASLDIREGGQTETVVDRRPFRCIGSKVRARDGKPSPGST